MARLNDLLESVDELPVLPQTVCRMMAALQGDGVSSADLAKIASGDEALALAIVRWANSALYGRPGRVFTLQESIGRLGTTTLIKIVLQQKTSSMFINAGAAYHLERGELWRSAIGGAIAAEQLARETGYDHPDAAFLCGLLRDVGQIVLDEHYGSTYAELLEKTLLANRPLIDAERAAFGFDHAQVGAALAKRWNLPDLIADAIGFHHDPPPEPDRRNPLFDLVHAADFVVRLGGLGIGVDGLHYRLAEHVRTGLDITRASTERWIVRVWNELHKVEDLVFGTDHKRISA